MSGRPDHDAQRELETRLDAALDALNAEQPPRIEPDDAELWELLDTACLVRRLREPALPDDTFPQRIAAALATQLAPPGAGAHYSPNGRAEMTHLTPPPRWRRARAALALLAALMRSLTVVILAGMVAGIVAGGVGGRIAMYVAGQIFVREHPGEVAITESSGQVVGTFSWGGTVDLLFEGMFYGIIGGLLLLLLKPWLSRYGRRYAGLLFGLLLLAGAGTTVISSDNPDFARIGFPVLNVLMFAAIFVAFGPLVVAVERRVDRRMPELRLGGPWRPARLLGMLAVLVIGGLALLPLTMLVIAAPIQAGHFAIEMVRAEDLRDALTHAAGLLIFLTLAIGLPLARAARTPRLAAHLARYRIPAAFASGRYATAFDILLLLSLLAGGALLLSGVIDIVA
ncbi:MAG: hypothetical protein DCC58_15165 [Chloroflexi bacterium]|nr:MAG: hypothetical protein DCC58_15165 [Chloroflexota bacterium]